MSTISTAVEEQLVTTNEIANNVAQTSLGVEEVSGNAAQNSTVTRGISKEISEADQAVKEIAESGLKVHSSAEDLSQIAENLKAMVGRFKV